MLSNLRITAQLLFGAPVVVAAQQDSLPRVVITATRVDVSAGAGISSTTVIDRTFIERTGVRDVAELLRFVPGVTVARSGGPGAQSSLFLRGGESDYVRFLIDGVPVNDPGGAFDLSWLSVDDVDRIEVVRGPASVLYGTDAVTGVVQVFTRRERAAFAEGQVAVGRYGNRLTRGTASAGSERLNLTVGAAREQSDGLLAFNSDYTRDVANAVVRAMPSSSTRLEVSARGVSDEFHFPTDGAGDVSDRNAFRDNRRFITAATVSQVMSSRVRGELSFTAMNTRAIDDDRPDSPSDTAGFYYYDAVTNVRRRVADARVHLMLSPSSVFTLGAEAVREAQRGNDSSNYSFERSRFAEDRRNSAVYGQWLSEHGPLSITAGGRYDDNDTFGAFRTARAGFAWRAWRGGSLRFSAGTAFKAPTFFESFNTAFSTGNADLEPERSRSWEAGVRHTTGRLTIGATWFDQRFRDMIQYAFLALDQPNYFNVAAATARGLELELAANISSRVRAGANTTLLRTRVDDAGLQTGESATFVTGNKLLRRPALLASGHLAVDLPGRTTTDVAVTYTGKRDDRDFGSFPATPVELPAWTRVDLGFTRPVLELSGARFDLLLRLENALDSSHEEIANYPAPGRSLTIGLRAASLRR